MAGFKIADKRGLEVAKPRRKALFLPGMDVDLSVAHASRKERYTLAIAGVLHLSSLLLARNLHLRSDSTPSRAVVTGCALCLSTIPEDLSIQYSSWTHCSVIIQRPLQFQHENNQQEYQAWFGAKPRPVAFN